MEHDNLSDNSPKVVKKTVNLGKLPYFSDVDDSGKRMVMFHQDSIVERFPRVLSLTRVLDALEINLFLEHRYKGLFMPPKRGGKKNSLGGVSLVTMNSLANSMSLFLQWIEAHDVDWHEVYAVSDSDKAKAVKKSTSAASELSSTKMLQLEFWTKLKEYVQDNKHQIKLRKARPQHWHDISIGTSNAHIGLSVNSQTNQLGCEIYISDSKDLYDGLEAKKDEIESQLGEKLEWKPLPEGKASRIKLSRNGELNNQDSWEDYHQWLCDKVQKFQSVFGSAIKNTK